MLIKDYLSQTQTKAAHLARAISVPPSLLSQWSNGDRPVPMDKCLKIERATSGAVTCEELRPDVDWSRPEPQKEAA
jgi:DNA-binding transcriptional regulator YdaS (Cro superfamily)